VDDSSKSRKLGFIVEFKRSEIERGFNTVLKAPNQLGNSRLARFSRGIPSGQFILSLWKYFSKRQRIRQSTMLSLEGQLPSRGQWRVAEEFASQTEKSGHGKKKGMTSKAASKRR
jgi:hypothetical protein